MYLIIVLAIIALAGVLFITTVILFIWNMRLQKHGKTISLEEDMPEGFEKQSPKRKTQIALLKFQNEIHEIKAIKYDFKNRKLYFKIKK